MKFCSILAIDPGPKESAFVVINGQMEIITCAKVDNYELLNIVKEHEIEKVVIEMIASYGMPVGREVFETCVWIGRYKQASPCSAQLVYRKDVKIHLCGSTKAKDGNVRKAIIDLYADTEKEAKGTKKNPGPLYGVSGDVWAALGVAITYRNSIINLAS